MQRIVESTTGTPAYVRNGRLDILYAKQIAQALYSGLFRDPVRPVNVARFLFLDPRGTEFYADWEHAANDAAALLRAEAGRDPYDRRLSDRSVSCPRAARSSACAGPRTTSSSTAPTTSASITRWSETSP